VVLLLGHRPWRRHGWADLQMFGFLPWQPTSTKSPQQPETKKFNKNATSEMCLLPSPSYSKGRACKAQSQHKHFMKTVFPKAFAILWQLKGQYSRQRTAARLTLHFIYLTYIIHISFVLYITYIFYIIIVILIINIYLAYITYTTDKIFPSTSSTRHTSSTTHTLPHYRHHYLYHYILYITYVFYICILHHLQHHPHHLQYRQDHLYQLHQLQVFNF
jgi:hypothetical protein